MEIASDRYAELAIESKKHVVYGVLRSYSGSAYAELTDNF